MNKESAMRPTAPRDLNELREDIQRLERKGRHDSSSAALPLGVKEIDRRLPGGGLRLAGLHELWPAWQEGDEGAATGFLLALSARLLARHPGTLLWVSRADDLYAPAAALAGVPPGRLLRARARRPEDLLWALEQGLQCHELAGVAGEVAGIDPVAARRLQLAAEKAGRPCFLLQRCGRSKRPTAGSPAVTRWRIGGLPSDPILPRGLVGRARWRLELLRCRGGQPAAFEVEWNDATGALALAAPLCGGKTAAIA